jgi:hypothetical protein
VVPENGHRRHLSYNNPKNSSFLATQGQIEQVQDWTHHRCVSANNSRLGARIWRDRPLNSSLSMILCHGWVRSSSHACPRSFLINLLAPRLKLWVIFSINPHWWDWTGEVSPTRMEVKLCNTVRIHVCVACSADQLSQVVSVWTSL